MPLPPDRSFGGSLLSFGAGAVRSLKDTGLGLLDLLPSVARGVGNLFGADTSDWLRFNPAEQTATEEQNPEASSIGYGLGFMGQMLVPAGWAKLITGAKTALASERAFQLLSQTERIAQMSRSEQLLARAPDLARTLKLNAASGGLLGFVATPGDLSQRFLSGLEGASYGAIQTALGPVAGQSLLPRLGRTIVASAIPGPVTAVQTAIRGEVDWNSVWGNAGMGLINFATTPGRRQILKAKQRRERPFQSLNREPLDAYDSPAYRFVSDSLDQIERGGPTEVLLHHQGVANAERVLPPELPEPSLSTILPDHHSIESYLLSDGPETFTNFEPITPILEPVPEPQKPAFEPIQVTRHEEPGIVPTTDKPQGLYLNRAGGTTGVEPEMTEKYVYQFSPQNPLDVSLETRPFEHERFRIHPRIPRSGEGSSGLKALQILLPEKEFLDLTKRSKKDLAELLQTKYPQVDWNNYYDSYEMLEGLGGIIAREHGYDSIIDTDEVVALTSKSLKGFPQSVEIPKFTGEGGRDTSQFATELPPLSNPERVLLPEQVLARIKPELENAPNPVNTRQLIDYTVDHIIQDDSATPPDILREGLHKWASEELGETILPKDFFKSLSERGLYRATEPGEVAISALPAGRTRRSTDITETQRILAGLTGEKAEEFKQQYLAHLSENPKAYQSANSVIRPLAEAAASQPGGEKILPFLDELQTELARLRGEKRAAAKERKRLRATEKAELPIVVDTPDGPLPWKLTPRELDALERGYLQLTGQNQLLAGSLRAARVRLAEKTKQVNLLALQKKEAARESAATALAERDLSSAYTELKKAQRELQGFVERREGSSVRRKGADEKLTALSNAITRVSARTDWSDAKKIRALGRLQHRLNSLIRERTNIVERLQSSADQIRQIQQTRETQTLLSRSHYQNKLAETTLAERLLQSSREADLATLAYDNLGLNLGEIANRHFGQFSATGPMIRAMGGPEPVLRHLGRVFYSAPGTTPNAYLQKGQQVLHALNIPELRQEIDQLRVAKSLAKNAGYDLNLADFDSLYHLRAVAGGGDDMKAGLVALHRSNHDTNPSGEPRFLIRSESGGAGENFQSFLVVEDRLHPLDPTDLTKGYVSSGPVTDAYDAAYWMDAARWKDAHHSPDLTPAGLSNIRINIPRSAQLAASRLPWDPPNGFDFIEPATQLPPGKRLWNATTFWTSLDKRLRKMGIKEDRLLAQHVRRMNEAEFASTSLEQTSRAKLMHGIHPAVSTWLDNSIPNQMRMSKLLRLRSEGIQNLIDERMVKNKLTEDDARASITPHDLSTITADQINLLFGSEPIEFQQHLAATLPNIDDWMKWFFRQNGLEHLVPEVHTYWMRMGDISSQLKAAHAKPGISVDAYNRDIHESGHFRRRRELTNTPPVGETDYQQQMRSIGLSSEDMPIFDALGQYIKTGIRYQQMRLPVAEFQVALERLGGLPSQEGQPSKPGVLGEVERAAAELMLRRAMGLGTDTAASATAKVATNLRAHKLGAKMYQMGQSLKSRPDPWLGFTAKHQIQNKLEELGQLMGYKGATGGYQRYLDFFGNIHMSQTFGFNPSIMFRDLVTTNGFLIAPRFNSKYGMVIGTTKDVMGRQFMRILNDIQRRGLLPDTNMSQQSDLMYSQSNFRAPTSLWEHPIMREHGMEMYRSQDRVTRLNIAFIGWRAFEGGLAKYRKTGKFGDFIRETALDTHSRGLDTGFLKELKGLIDRNQVDEAKTRYLRSTINGLAFDYGSMMAPKMYSTAWGRFLGRYGSWPMNAVDLLHRTFAGPAEFAHSLKKAGLDKEWGYTYQRGVAAGAKNAMKFAAAAEIVYTLFAMMGADAADYIPWLHNVTFTGGPGVSMMTKTLDIVSGEPETVARLKSNPSREIFSLTRRVLPFPAGNIIRNSLGQLSEFPRKDLWKYYFGIREQQSTTSDRLVAAFGLNPYRHPLSYYKPLLPALTGQKYWGWLQDTLHNRVSSVFAPNAYNLRQSYSAEHTLP